MLQLISDHGSTISTGFFHNTSNSDSLLKCLRYLRNVLNLEAQVATLDAKSASYTLLCQMAEKSSSVAFKGCVFLAVKRSDQSVWGFIKINGLNQKPTSVQIKKALQAIKDILEINISNPNEKKDSRNLDSSTLLLESTLESSHRVSTSLFQDNNFTAFINLSEWIAQDQIFTLKSLREFSDSLLFVSEIMDLTRSQRTVLALFSMLPSSLKQSSLVICTKLDEKNLSEALSGEKSFLAAFAEKKRIYSSKMETSVLN